MAITPDYNTMPDANGAESSNSVGFLDLLPRELRDQIYREILLQPIGYGAARRRHKFETSILRVNKQIHQEASRVLYEENAWVVFEVRSPVGGNLDVPSDRHLIRISRNIPRSGRLAFGGIPSLRVRVQHFNLRDYEVIHYTIVPLEWVRDMTREFVRDDRSYYEVYLEDNEFAVHFHANLKHESQRRMAMEFLELIRGVRKAKIYGLTSPSLRASLTKRMRTPLRSIDELIDRTSIYIHQAELMLARGQVHLAEELYNHGYDSSIWAFREGSMTDITPMKSRIFSSTLYKSLEGSAVCSLRHRDSYHACWKLKHYIEKHSDLSDSQKATGFYYYGLAAVAIGYENSALLGFTEVLMLNPGCEAVDKEVDALEERVTHPNAVRAMMLADSPGVIPEQTRIFWSLKGIKPYRHRSKSPRSFVIKEAGL